ncbi:shikimate kinase [Shewanella olleyana]|uniref:AAA family ATPase n=1 Tax=Shewanella olleyana TaxID=135626 RepID=UPI00200F9398|nr:shikimate kinase [Shewanella olleyana]
MSKVVIFGNSGSGKSTLAKQFAANKNLAHLDLDTIAWLAVNPPQRMPIADSKILIDEFLNLHQSWVIEGCYSDLLELVFPQTDEVIFLNLPISACIDNAKSRPWEPHKYASKQAQDENLTMLIDWISQYDSRSDTFSKVAHERLFEQFVGTKTMLTSNR